MLATLPKLACSLTAVLSISLSAAAPIHTPHALHANNPGNAQAAFKSVVALRTSVPADARTANTLGTERTGSAIVIDASGLLLTIGYLLLEATEATVTTGTGLSVSADIVAYDHNTGLGLLRAAKPLDVGPIKLGSSAQAVASTPVVIASHGGPAAARPAFVVSRRAFAGFWEYLLEDAVFTSPPHPLFAGAALLGAQGELLGVGSLLVPDAMPATRAIPGNMFVPIDQLKPILGELLIEGRNSADRRPWLGIYASDASGTVVVGAIADGGPAASSDIRAGDAIVGVGGQPVTSVAGFYQRLWQAGSPGIKVRLNIWRDNKIIELTLTSADRYDWLKIPPQ